LNAIGAADGADEERVEEGRPREVSPGSVTDASTRGL
jgi:hypothetical protein